MVGWRMQMGFGCFGCSHIAIFVSMALKSIGCRWLGVEAIQGDEVGRLGLGS
jgi:hypothetical protein